MSFLSRIMVLKSKAHFSAGANNRPTDPQWAQSLEPGWQQKRMNNFNVLVSGGFQDEDLVNDGWTDIIQNLLVMARKKVAAGEAMGDVQAMMQPQMVKEICTISDAGRSLLKTAMEKLGLSNNSELTRYAIAHQVISDIEL